VFQTQISQSNQALMRTILHKCGLSSKFYLIMQEKWAKEGSKLWNTDTRGVGHAWVSDTEYKTLYFQRLKTFDWTTSKRTEPWNLKPMWSSMQYETLKIEIETNRTYEFI